ncbi:hypothetical protein OROHE_005708 [Orobanche hederae]
MSRIESTEKENTSLKYEVRVLEKELEIRNEEREFNRRSADASYKQQLESMKKVAKLESECQRLRLLVRKRLPGPAAVAKMQSEIDVLGSVEMRRRRTKSSINGFTADHTVENALDTFNKQVSFLTEQLCAVEEENNSLKEALDKKANELQGQTNIEPSKRGRRGFAPYEVSHASMSDVGSDDKISCAESWASALISELEHFKPGKQRGSPLAIISVDKQSGSPQVSCKEEIANVSPSDTGLNEYASEVIGNGIIPVSDFSSGVSNQESEKSPIRKAPDWLNNILEVVLEQTRITQRKPYEILEDVTIALTNISEGHPAIALDSKESENPLDASHSLCAGGCIARKPTDKYSLIDSTCGMNDDDALLTDRNIRNMQSDLGKSILKIIELVEGITLPRKDWNFFPYKDTETSSDYTVCSRINFSLQDVSSMKDEIKKHLDLDEARSECEVEVGLISQLEVNKMCLNDGQLSCLPVASEATGLQKSFEMDELQYVIVDENNKLKYELTSIKSAKSDLEARLQSALDKTESLMTQLRESKQIIAHLRAEVDALKISKAEAENQMLAKQDLDAKCTVSNAELNEAQQKSSCLEMELENKSSRCEELEAACLELHLQLERCNKENNVQ